jgi:TetR/AcrR family transcriptional regulator, cholesterol catabolism regulator
VWFRPDGRESAEQVADSIADFAVQMLSRSHGLSARQDAPPRPRTGTTTSTRYTELLATTLRAFRERGYSGTSMQDIAAEVGILKGSVYHYIESKYDLLIEIFEEAQRQLDGVIESVRTMDGRPEERLRAAIERQTAWLLRNDAQSAILFREWAFLAPRDRERVTARRKRLEGFLRGLIEECQRAGLADPGMDVTRAMRFVLGAIYSVSEWYRPQGKDSPERVAEAYTEFTLAVLLTTNP